MKFKFLLTSILVSTFLSWTVAFASYFCYTKPFTIDVEFIYRGWPLCWMTESWSYWSQPPVHQVSFQPASILIDFVFYAVIFQIPMQLYLYSREIRKLKITGQDVK